MMILRLLALLLAVIAAFLVFAVFFELEKTGLNLPVHTFLVHVVLPPLASFVVGMAVFLRLRRKGSSNGTGTE